MKLRPLTKLWFTTAGILDFGVFLQLFVLTGHTATFFAWTIAAPLTETFMGAAYGAGSLLMWLSWREKRWAQARIALPSVLVFTLLTLVATLLHLDKFHWGAPHPLPAVFFGWFWLLIYVVTPVVQGAVIWLQARQPGQHHSGHTPLADGLRPLLILHAALLLSVGLLFFAFPATSASWWIWPLTLLTARMIGAWLLGVGLILVHALVEDDRLRVRNGLAIYGVFSLLQLIALARYWPAVTWQSPLSWLYVIMLLSALAIGGYSWVAGRRAIPSTFAHTASPLAAERWQ